MKSYPLNTILAVDCLEGLKSLPDNYVQCCVTSPPYFGLRDYGVEGQLGLERTPEEYIEKLIDIFREVKRVLKNDGTLWVNIGDSYWGGKGKSGSGSQQIQNKRHKAAASLNKGYGQANAGPGKTRPQDLRHQVIKAKDLVGVPWMLAFALRNSGWWLRQEVIWHKPNCMPESVDDRCTRCHEHIFMFAKSSRYYYNNRAIKTALQPSSIIRNQNGKGYSKYSAGTPGFKPQSINKPVERKQDGHGPRHKGFNQRYYESNLHVETKYANRRSVWKISTKALKEKHFAAFPKDIPQICIMATTREGDIVLDPFMGAGTTALVAAALDRNYLGFELNPEYIAIANRRLRKQEGLFFKG